MAGRRTVSKRYTVAVYYFPNYHVDPRNEAVHGPGWTEWELVRRAEPRFPGHVQPRVPSWGYEDEADPKAMARKIAAAADHGVDVFLFDWYWYDDGSFLARGLEQGFLQAKNDDKLQFALMWANHDWVDIHPAKLHAKPPLLYPGAVTAATFAAMTDYIIDTYFRHASYWRPGGCPYFSIYELHQLIKGLGGLEATRTALQSFREKTRAAGFPDLHLNLVAWQLRILPGETALTNPAEVVKYLGFDSATSYVWVHHVGLSDFPTTDYRAVMARAVDHWQRAVSGLPVPYYPNVTVGWDPSPRTVQSDRYLPAGYPFTPVLAGNTPAAFKEALIQARDFLKERPPEQRILTINAWNEWTEGSYLEPDTVHGMGYLEAVREVFGGS
jgi:hypothetical protein